MNSYELTIVLAGSMPEAKQKAVLEKIKKAVAASLGKVDKEDNWGKKPFAYPVMREKEGFYFYFELSLLPDQVAGINRLVENDEQVLRHLVVVKSSKGTTGRTKEQKDEETEKQQVDKKKKKAETVSKSTKGKK